jgi:hypothetical protein
MNEISNEENNIYEIYKITNTIENKSYIGVAKKWVKLVKQKYYKYGGIGRYKRHLSNAFSKNEKCANDCPIFYQAIRLYGSTNFILEILKIFSSTDENIKKVEEDEIKKYKTHDPEFGYNFLLSVKKPIIDSNLIDFKKKKEIGNKNRAINGDMRKKDHNKNLPINIYYRFSKNNDNSIKHEGYFVQIKTNGKIINKAFLSDKLTLEEKLNRAKDFLASITTDI